MKIKIVAIMKIKIVAIMKIKIVAIMKIKDAVIFFLPLVLSISSGASETHFVDPGSATPTPPYTTWNAAATSIQDAIDAASDGDLILVTNGIYATGGRAVYGELTNRVVIDKAVTVQSVNGAQFTFIVGNSPIGPEAVRCAYLTNGAVLSGFTLTNGAALTSYQGQNDQIQRIYSSGAGVWCEGSAAVITNCVLINNFAEYSFGGQGGGALSGTLISCLLTGNKAVNGGGASESTLLNCVLSNNVARSYGGGAHYSSLTNCIVAGNHADSSGGGVSQGTLQSCTVLENSVNGTGGGLYVVTAIDTTLFKNSARSLGGGAYRCTLINAVISENFAVTGGGTYQGSASNSRISDNFALLDGGGAYQSVMNNCAVVNNSATANGGGSFSGVLNDCTLAGNSAFVGGGVAAGALTNCIVYFNTATNGSNYTGTNLSYCCTTPLPPTGVGNIATDPLLADLFHLSAASPCLAAGFSAATTGVDIDGDTWLNPPSIGCDEFVSSSATGPLEVQIRSDYANAQPDAEIRFTANIIGHADFSRWDFGDGTAVTNQPYSSHSWTAAGIYSVNLIAGNVDNPNGVTNSVWVQIVEDPILYVAQGTQIPVAPYLSWETAATNIQDAVDAAFAGGSSVLVSNGVYRTGGGSATGVLSNRVCATKPVNIASVNGPEATVIEGYRLPPGQQGPFPFFQDVGDGAVRCVYLCDGARLTGFTLTNGATRAGFNLSASFELNGGGVYCQSTNAFVFDCLIISNACSVYGGGAFSGTLENCQIVSNHNYNFSLGGGGGAAFSAVLNSSLVGNSTGVGGGAFSSYLSNCLVMANSDGVVTCAVYNCTITGNAGSGMTDGSAFDSIISSNRSRFSSGGGATSSTLSNCIVFENRALNGGGAYNCILNFCTLSNNYATNQGGGLYSSFTTIPSQQPSLGFGNTFIGNTSGQAGGGLYSMFNSGSITNWHFIGNAGAGAGGGVYIASGTRSFIHCTFDGNTASDGGGLFGFSTPTATTTCLDSTFSNNVATANGGGVNNATLRNCYLGSNQALNGGGAYNSSIGDCVLENNRADATGGGGYYSFGLPITNCAFYGNVAGNGGGLYTSGSVSNCIFIGNAAATNGGGIFGPISLIVRNSFFYTNQATFGGGGYYGVYYGCVISGNFATDSGGGVYVPGSYSSSSNCMITANMAGTNGGGVYGGGWIRSSFNFNSAGQNGGGGYSCGIQDSEITDNSTVLGGGVYSGQLYQCLLTRNRAMIGGAAYNISSEGINNCTITGNFATNKAGGVYSLSLGKLVSSIVYFNSAPTNSNYAANGISYSCLFPMPMIGTGNITNDPAFIDFAQGNFRLQTNSPCINLGNNPVNLLKDLDGRPRRVGVTIDIGAYEFQGPGIGEFTYWLQQNGLPTNGSADYVDTDLDLMNNWQEWIAGTIPTDADSVLKMLSLTNSAAGNTVSWQSVAGQNYFLQRAVNLGDSPAFSSIQSNLVGEIDITTYTDNTATNSAAYFYRIGVQ